MKIIQIVGYKNSGKTTLATAIIDMLSKQGYRVGSLKHHGHGGVPLGFDETDSERHKAAGAVFAGVEGDGVFQVSTPGLTVEQMVKFYQFMGIDILVVEGFKREPLPKIVLVQEGDEGLLQQVENVKAIVSSLPSGANLPYPVFEKQQVDELLSWLIKDLVKSDWQQIYK